MRKRNLTRHQRIREWLLWHAPDWYITYVWHPIFTYLEGRKR